METVLTIVLVIAALAGMMIYVQRGIQGGLSSATSGLGAQFDPRDAWNESHGMGSLETTTQVPRSGAVAADMLDGWLSGVPGGTQQQLPSLPAAQIVREPSTWTQESAMTNDWIGFNNASYCDDRTGAGCP